MAGDREEGNDLAGGVQGSKPPAIDVDDRDLFGRTGRQGIGDRRTSRRVLRSPSQRVDGVGWLKEDDFTGRASSYGGSHRTVAVDHRGKRRAPKPVPGGSGK